MPAGGASADAGMHGRHSFQKLTKVFAQPRRQRSGTAAHAQAQPGLDAAPRCARAVLHADSVAAAALRGAPRPSSRLRSLCALRAATVAPAPGRPGREAAARAARAVLHDESLASAPLRGALRHVAGLRSLAGCAPPPLRMRKLGQAATPRRAVRVRCCTLTASQPRRGAAH
jgi:hypothetical protein